MKPFKHFMLCALFIVGAVVTGYGFQFMYCPLIFGGLALIISVLSAVST